jgi:hypothetical protein
MSDQRETLLEIQKLLQRRDVNRAYEQDLLNERRTVINKLKRLKDRIESVKQEISNDGSSIQHFLELLNRITGPDKADNDLLNKVLSHEYAKKLLEPPIEEEGSR